MRNFTAFVALALASCSGLSPTEDRPIASAAPATPEQIAAMKLAKEEEAKRVMVGEQTPAFVPGPNLEIVEVLVDLTDPTGQRKLVPYLLKSDEWMILKCELITQTTKRYRFQRVASSRETPEVDPLMPPRKK